MDMDSNIDSLEAVRDAVFQFVTELLEEGHKPFAVAGVMSNIALSMYKTSLPPEDYNTMMDYISQNRDRINRIDSNQASVH